MPLGQLPPDPGSFLLKFAKNMAKIPLAGLMILASGIFAYLGFWTLIRLGQLIYIKFLSQKWMP